MEFDLSQFGKRQEIYVTKDFKDIDEMNLDKLSDALCQITSVRKMNEESREILIKIIRRLKDYTDQVSYEFIAYLIYTAKHPNSKGVNILNKQGLWENVKKEMQRVRIAIKTYDPEFKVDTHRSIYKMFSGNKVFYTKVTRSRDFRFITSSKI